MALKPNISISWGRRDSSSAKAGFGSRDTFGAEITVQRVDGRVENEVAVRARFQVTLDFDLNGRGESSL